MIIKSLLFVLGFLSLVLGIVGIFLPILPTTPFLLLSAACFARSSVRFHQWLVNHRWFGPYIRYYMDGLGIPLKIKIRAILILCFSMGVSIVFFVPWRWLQVAMGGVALAVSIYIWTRPTAIELPSANVSDSNDDQ